MPRFDGFRCARPAVAVPVATKKVTASCQLARFMGRIDGDASHGARCQNVGPNLGGCLPEMGEKGLFQRDRRSGLN
jgi:hypothetical protein